MDILTRLIYLGALIAIAVVYTATMPPESLTFWNLVRYLMPATSVGLLFVLAKGVLGEGLVKHVIALILVIVVIALVSTTLSSTGLVTGIKTAADIVGNISGIANGALPLNLSIP
jgi:MFS-type transporter involved in bile tolerance (Atg22 family)